MANSGAGFGPEGSKDEGQNGGSSRPSSGQNTSNVLSKSSELSHKLNDPLISSSSIDISLPAMTNEPTKADVNLDGLFDAPPQVQSSESLSDPVPPNKVDTWLRVTGSYRRERSIEGLFWGFAVGEALGLGRGNLSRREAIRIYGRGPVSFQLIPGVGLIGDRTQRLCLTAQALLRSKSQQEEFQKEFAKRLRWYALTLPLSGGWGPFLASARLWLNATPDKSGGQSTNNSALPVAMALATFLQGTGHSVERWAVGSTKVTHQNPHAIAASKLLARTCQFALLTTSEDLKPDAILNKLLEETDDEALSPMLAAAKNSLERGHSPHRFAEGLKEIGKLKSAPFTAVVAIYAWLRYPKSYRRAVQSAILVGQDAAAIGALTGGLAGIHLGLKSIPKNWTEGLTGWLDTKHWIDAATGRLTDWPHGSEDLHSAPSLPVQPASQMFRSMALNVSLLCHRTFRLPWTLSRWTVPPARKRTK